jgi:oxazoline/thiazoline dehydrogenase
MADFSYQLADSAAIQQSSQMLTIAVDRRKQSYAAPFVLEAQALQLLSDGPQTPEQLIMACGLADSPAGQAKLHFLLLQLDSLGGLVRHLMAKGQSVVTLVPNAGFIPPRQLVWDAHAHYRLSRFASLQPVAGRWAMGSPLGHSRIVSSDATLLSALMAMVNATPFDSFAAQLPYDRTFCEHLFGLLVFANLISPQDDQGDLPEDRDIALSHWEPHDLLFHSRSRMGRHVGKFGSTFRFIDDLGEPPALPPPMASVFLSLPTPDLEALQQQDAPFQSVLETRKSSRSFHQNPLTREGLGEILFRSMRLKERRSKGEMEVAFYPFPGGGARSELSAYIAVNGIEGLNDGLYRYDPEQHGLWHVREADADVRRLFVDACSALAVEAPPPALLVLTSRFRRMSWKYQGMSYAVTLKNVGAVFQTLYLSCAAMGLAGCALGGGDADLFSRCIGSDYVEEGSVGEFALGGPLSHDD